MKENQYFQKFPLISYRDNISVDITRRVDFDSNIKSYIQAFYEYVLTEDQRIEDVAFNYYNDVDLDWLIYLSNDIIDPYFDVPLTNKQFDSYMVKKYGSIEASQLKVFKYRNNHRQDDSILDSAAYNSLVGQAKRYFNPIVTQNGIIGYERKQNDIFFETNYMLSLQFVTTPTTVIPVGETIQYGDAYAEVVYSDEKTITLKNIYGNFNTSADYTITGKFTGYTAEVDHTTYNVLVNTIPVVEQQYYSPYSYYQYETDQNEAKRLIKLIDKSYAERLNQDLNKLMK